MRSALEGLSLILDGYTHSGYAQIMEMYSASPQGGQFHMSGIWNPERLRLFLHWTAQFAHPALNAFTQLLRDTGHPDEGDQLMALRKRLEASDEYPRDKPESSEGVV